MENFEIVLKGFPKKKLNAFIHNEVQSQSSFIIRSLFYDNNLKKDKEFREIKSLESILSPHGSGSIFFSQFYFDVLLKEVLLLFSFAKNDGDIEINVPEKTFFCGASNEIADKCTLLVKQVLKIKTKYEIPEILIGLEPAVDADMCVLAIKENIVDVKTAVKMLTDRLYR